MRTEALASPLTVWIGSKRYTFPAGRDVTVGRDRRSDIRLDGMDAATSPTHLVLHHDGRQWVALDRSQHGIYVDGVRMSTVFIRDGRAITVGDPRRGPRLVFRLGAPSLAKGAPPRGVRRPPPSPPVPADRQSGPGSRPAPPPARPPHRSGPSKRPTRPASMPAMPEPPGPPPTTPPPQPHPKPPEAQWGSPPAWPQVAQRKGHDLVGWLTGAMQRLILHRPEPRPHEAGPTGPLPRADVAGSEARSPRPAPKLGALQANQLGLNVDGQQLLAEVSFTAQPGTLTAVVGPSQAGSSALVNIVAGAMRPGSGEVTAGGYDLCAENVRPYIGMVPRGDLVHPQLTIEQALGYVAELRLPPATSAEERRQVVDRVIGELELNSLRTIQVGKLSSEQRKRASVAAELITGPSLLVLDEPTADLDPARQRQTMATLRRLADAGRTVVLSTTAVDHINVCDQVVLLTSSGTPAFSGPPAEIEAALSNTSWAEIFAHVGPEQRQLSPPAPHPPEAVEPVGPPEHIRLWRQIAVAARRQAWLIVGDQRYFIFLTILPLLFGALAMVVPGHAGLGQADPYGDSPDEALEILVVLNLGAVVMGTALTIRDLFGERRIFRREQADGLSTSAYLVAKIFVYSLVATVQTGIITTVAVVGKGPPARGAVLLGSPVLELYVTLAVTAIVSAIIALTLSSLAKYKEQLLLMAVPAILLALLFSGGAFPLAGRFGLEQISWLLPSRWGFAASASTVDVHAINPLVTGDESWTHSPGWWVFDMAMLIAFGVVCIAFLRWRLRRIQKPGGSATDGEHNWLTTEQRSRRWRGSSRCKDRPTRSASRSTTNCTNQRTSSRSPKR